MAEAAAIARTEPDLTISLQGKAGDGVQAGMGATVAMADKTREAIRKNQEKLLANSEQRAPAEEEPLEIIVREDVESISLRLPDGREVFLEPPPAGQLMFNTATILAGNEGGSILPAVVRAILFIRTIDGRPVDSIASKIAAIKFMNDLGEGALDIITTAVQINWPPMMMSDLQVIKKKIRGS